MIKHIICDLGNVILMHDFQRTVNALAGHCSATPDEIYEEISGGCAYRLFSKGLISKEVFYSELSYDLCSLMSYDEFIKAWECTFTGVNQEFSDLACKLHQQGYSLHMLLNTDEIHWAYAQKACRGVFYFFDSFFLSFNMHLKKPNPAIYFMVLNELMVRPGECLFIDDLQENVEVAELMGIKGLLYDKNEHELFVKKLYSVLSPA